MTTEKLSYSDYDAMPLGAVVADREGYWAALQRHYVKTGEARWAVFFHLPTEDEVTEAVADGRSNVSPAPLGTGRGTGAGAGVVVTSSSEQTTALIAEARESAGIHELAYADLVGRLADALEAATKDIEYGWSGRNGEPGIALTLENAQWYADNLEPKGFYIVQQRVKAGPWVPVGGTE